jgi:hypothetical protein
MAGMSHLLATVRKRRGFHYNAALLLAPRTIYGDPAGITNTGE